MKTILHYCVDKVSCKKYTLTIFLGYKEIAYLNISRKSMLRLFSTLKKSPRMVDCDLVKNNDGGFSAHVISK